MTFDDYGPYRGAPGDPRTPDDDGRDFDQLTPSEQRTALSELPHAELVEQCMDALADAELWHSTATQQQRATAAARAEVQRLQNDVAAMADALRVAIEREEHATARYERLYASVYPRAVAA